MSSKKRMALLLVLMMIIMGLLSGCSNAEKGYYNLIKEANNQKVCEQTGSIELKMEELPDSVFEGEDVFTKETVKKAIDNSRIDFQGKADINQGLFHYDFTIVDNSTGVENELISIIGKDDTIYIKIDGLVSFLKKFGDAKENKEINRILKDVEYVSLSSQDLEEIMPPGSSEVGLTDNFLQRASEQQKVQMRLLDGLINQVYNKYEANLVTGTNNKYTLTLRVADSIDIIKPAAVYTIENIDQLGTFLKSFLNGLTEDEITALGLTPELMIGIIPGIDQMVDDVNQNRDQYLAEIENLSADSMDELTKILNDTELVSTIEKKGTQTYETTTKLRIHFTDEEPTESLNCTFNLKQTLKAVRNVQVVAPTAKVITLTDLEKRMPNRMTVDVDNGNYSLQTGFNTDVGTMDVHFANNYTYLPMRKIAETLDEKAGWDGKVKQAYVEKDGQRIKMTGIIIEGRTFVKTRDFQQLGYKVNWDMQERTVMIEK